MSVPAARAVFGRPAVLPAILLGLCAITPGAAAKGASKTTATPTTPATAVAPAATNTSSGARDTTQTAPAANPVQDSLAAARAKARAGIPDSTWGWPLSPRSLPCAAPLETPGDCWRTVPDRAEAGTGFPGLRTGALNLRSLEPARTLSFHQAALEYSPYGAGGHNAFARHERDDARGWAAETWAPVQPLDTPVTDLHWVRGALLMNQFLVSLERMVGNRAYLGFDYGSNGAVKQYYDYAFQVHQPYLGGGRDSLSLVIQDTSHAISSRHVRARLGYWLDARTVVEGYADWLDNSSSLANPGHAARNDSTQLLYPASFTASTYGGVFARRGEWFTWRGGFRHGAWERGLQPRGDARYFENASGVITVLDAALTMPALRGAPRLTVRAERTAQDGALWLDGLTDSAITSPSANAVGDRETVAFDMRPSWGAGLLELDLRADATRRARPDGVTEALGGGDADVSFNLPLGFHLSGGAGWNREGAPEDHLFRNQPALGLYENPALTPRTQTRYGAGAGWTSRHIGFGAAWERHRFDDNWLPRVLPDADACARLADSTLYTDVRNICGGGPYGTSLPDSVALARTNVAEETRELAHVHGRLALGNWKLTLRNTYLLASTVRDPRLGFAAWNRMLPQNVLKGQLLWRRQVLDGRLGLQTRWDWEWFSYRYAFASDLDGTSRVLALDEYLALDFTTQMEIKSFLLYFRAMNLYHDRYATEPGVHPPGVNFRFGVDWRLRN